MPDREAIDRGFDFETRVANQLSGSLQPGSGNKFFAKSDVAANGLMTSCKSQQKFTWSEIQSYLREAIDLAFQTGDIPTLAVEDAGTNSELIVMRLSDFAKALKEVKIPESFQSKGLEKSESAKTPILLR